MQISKNFQLAEFVCRCGCGGVVVDTRLILALEEIRTMVGGPVYVSSGFRCRRHNWSIGGVPDSYHTQGLAADITCPNLDRLNEAARLSVWVKGMGVNRAKNFVHIDVRNGVPQGDKVIFTYPDSDPKPTPSPTSNPIS